MRRFGLMGAVFALSISAVPLTDEAQGQELCYKDYQEAEVALRSASAPELVATDNEIKKIESIGLDPARYIVEFEGKQVSIATKFYVLAQRLQEKIAKENDTAQKCAADVMPLRALADLAIIYETYGLSLLLPEEMTRIDFEEIRRGKILGGADALIPKARDDTLKALGIGGDAAKVIRDPKCIFGGC